MRLLSAFLLVIVSSINVFAGDTTCVDISQVNHVKTLYKVVSSAYIGLDEKLEVNYNNINFKPGLIHDGTIPPAYVSRKALMRFSICNNADTAVSVWFFPGFYFWDVDLYRINGSGLERIADQKPALKNNLSYRLITVGPHETDTIIAELSIVKTHINALRPRLVNFTRLNSFVSDVRSGHEANNIVTFLFSGLLLMMILFSLANYFQGGNKEFLYYSGYAFFLGGMLFTKALYDFQVNSVNYFLEGYFDFIMQGIGIMCYMIFMKQFLVTRKNHPFLYHLYNFGIGLIIASLVLFTYLNYFRENFVLQNMVENFTKLLLLAMTIIFLVYAFRHWNDKLLRYLFWGNLCLFIFSLLSQFTAMTSTHLLPGLLGSSLLYYEIGLFLELVFFLTGLNYKNRRLIIEQTRERERLKAENQLKEYEKELAVYKAQQEERERISADMHDELGSGMTAIRLMSEIARNKMKESTPVEIEKISRSADEVLNKMNAIIWSMNSGNDTLDNLVSYIRAYATEYFENTPVNCKVITPAHVPNIELSGDKRRNIFLCVKETLNNALKHSGASEIVISFSMNGDLLIEISDNGTGIDLQKLRQFGNGLKNISRRMESIGGSFSIKNENGTLTKLQLPL
jgi:signal transduction histidine kinase